MPKYVTLKRGTSMIVREKRGTPYLELVIYPPDEGERTYEQCAFGETDVDNPPSIGDTDGDKQPRESDP